MDEFQRLEDDAAHKLNWKRWGPYVSERQWGTVREDYSAHGDCWNYFPHDHARSRAYRWGEDGLLGISDRQCRLCFALALWNGKDGILKERLFGLTNHEGNHGEDVKEEYFYLRSSPTHSYMKALYKYPQAEFPYSDLAAVSSGRSPEEPEYELCDTGVFDERRYFDVTAEYAKDSPNSLLIKITATNRGPDSAPLHVIPQIWFRNTWSWGEIHDGVSQKPKIERKSDSRLALWHETLGAICLEIDPENQVDAILFTENETNEERIFGRVPEEGSKQYAKDALHSYIIDGKTDAVNPANYGTKAGIVYKRDIASGETVTIRLRLYDAREDPDDRGFKRFDATFAEREQECDAFYDELLPKTLSVQERNVALQAYAGLLWSKQFYHYVVDDWIKGDRALGPNPESRTSGRNSEWSHVYSRDVISMPDKWEYPWFAAWDLAFQVVPFARFDPKFARRQILLFLREWYMHPNGQLPAYEFAFGDVNPPVHAWAAWRVYRIQAKRGNSDVAFLASAFQKLLLNFTWWVNRKDTNGKNIFSGGFLGLDNISIFDRSSWELPTGGELQQADGTGWMAFFCSNMLRMALELAKKSGPNNRTAYEDMASKFLEHFVQIVDAINTHGGTGLWDDKDGFYYDQILQGRSVTPIKTRSLVGLIPLAAVFIIDQETLDALPGFAKRFNWFLKNQRGLSRHIAPDLVEMPTRWLISTIPRQRLKRVLRYLLDEDEFLSPYGIRSLSKFHKDTPFVLTTKEHDYVLEYVPGESKAHMFGGNSNWRGPVWFPLNHLLIKALESYHHFYGGRFTTQCPSKGGPDVTLAEAATEIRRRLLSLFMPDEDGHRPCNGGDERFASDEGWRDMVLFHEYFDGDNGKGLGASHQTGWTGLITEHIRELHDESLLQNDKAKKESE
ncbi:MAG: glucosidase [Verrucomicrobiae bacterium]|nr:glucosidase [Verrucomicrobiae bacterium]